MTYANTQQKPKPNLVIFKNEREAAPESKYPAPHYNGKITLPEGLEAGDYEVGIYLQTSKKTGKKFMSGNIKKAVKKPISLGNTRYNPGL